MKKLLFALLLVFLGTSAAFAAPISDAGKKDSRPTILLVPGHDNEASGTEYRGTKEVELNRLLADYLYTYLENDPEFLVDITQSKGDYTEKFQDYFDDNKRKIDSFRKKKIKEMNKLVDKGRIDEHEGVAHNKAGETVARRLYGINMYANENDIDLALHIHFNDHPGRGYNTEGTYNGFTIYIPEKQFKNSRESRSVAEKVFGVLSKYSPVSSLPGEAGGITEDQDLIAIGSNKSLEDTAALLVEYGYIYEPQFADPALRDMMLRDLAFRTYVGLKQAYGNGYDSRFATNILPYTFTKNLEREMENDPDILALQMILAFEGFYPGPHSTLNFCPISGSFGPCTEDALKAFQKSHGLSETGIFDESTRTLTNSVYGRKD